MKSRTRQRSTAEKSRRKGADEMKIELQWKKRRSEERIYTKKKRIKRVFNGIRIYAFKKKKIDMKKQSPSWPFSKHNPIAQIITSPAACAPAFARVWLLAWAVLWPGSRWPSRAPRRTGRIASPWSNVMWHRVCVRTVHVCEHTCGVGVNNAGHVCVSGRGGKGDEGDLNGRLTEK